MAGFQKRATAVLAVGIILLVGTAMGVFDGPAKAAAAAFPAENVTIEI
jgi:hypothetical protein